MVAGSKLTIKVDQGMDVLPTTRTGTTKVGTFTVNWTGGAVSATTDEYRDLAQWQRVIQGPRHCL